MMLDIFNRADPDRTDIQARGAAAASSMASSHPAHFRTAIAQRSCRRNQFEGFIYPFQDDEKMDLRDPNLRPVIMLAILLPKEALGNLRRVSKITNKATSFMLPRLFRQIRVRCSEDPNQLLENMEGLKHIGSYCRELVISLHGRPSSVDDEPDILGVRTYTDSTAPSSSTGLQQCLTRAGTQIQKHEIGKATREPAAERTFDPKTVQRKAYPTPSDWISGNGPHIHPALRDKSPSKESLNPSETPDKPSLWTQIFRRLPNLDALAIAIPNGNTTWHALTPLEWTLVSIRSALEKSCGDQSHHTIRRLRALRLAPITPISILPMRWSGLAALSTSNYVEWWNSFFWTSLSALELQLLSPHISCSTSQIRMFHKILHHYLSSFKNTLRKLRFVWLGRVGPNPLLLDLEAQLNPERPGHRSNKNFSQPAIVWTELREVWLNAVPVGPFAAAMIAARVPKLERIMTLDKKFWTDLEPGQIWDLDDPRGWRNILHECRAIKASESEAIDEIEKNSRIMERIETT